MWIRGQGPLLHAQPSVLPPMELCPLGAGLKHGDSDSSPVMRGRSPSKGSDHSAWEGRWDPLSNQEGLCPKNALKTDPK